MTVALALFFNLVTTLPARAAEPIFHTRSYNAFTQIFGRPEFFAGSMRDGGSSEARVTLNLVSFAEIDTSGTDGAELDLITRCSASATT
jgi:hypothetical protein